MRFVQSAHLGSFLTLCLCVLANGSFPIATAQASQLYTVTDLGSYLAAPAIAINNQGTVLLGNSLYSNGQTQVLPQPTGGVFTAQALNDLGQVAGFVNFSGAYNYDLALYSQGSLNVMTNLSGLDPTAINNSGQISGDSLLNYQMFLYLKGSLTAIGPLPGRGESASRGMNAAGEVIGISDDNSGNSQGFFFSNGKATLIQTPGVESEVSAINNLGQIVGDYALSQNSAGDHVFVFDGGKIQDLGIALNLPDEEDAAAAINDSGFVVGNAEIPTGLDAWIYRPGSGFTNLNSLISPASGWALQSAIDINNNGQIIGFGMHNGQFDDFLLTPAPEPSGLALLGMGLLAAGTVARSARARISAAEKRIALRELLQKGVKRR